MFIYITAPEPTAPVLAFRTATVVSKYLSLSVAQIGNNTLLICREMLLHVLKKSFIFKAIVLWNLPTLYNKKCKRCR